MKRQVILVVSERPLLCEDLKRLIEGTGVATEITAPDQENARSSLVGVAAAVVVVDKSDTEFDDQVCSLLREYQQAKVVLLGWNDDRLAIHYGRLILPVAMKNPIWAIRQKAFNSRASFMRFRVLEVCSGLKASAFHHKAAEQY